MRRIKKDGTETLWGTAPSKEASRFEENGVVYEAILPVLMLIARQFPNIRAVKVDVWHGHKTGFFLDQRPNRPHGFGV